MFHETLDNDNTITTNLYEYLLDDDDDCNDDGIGSLPELDSCSVSGATTHVDNSIMPRYRNRNGFGWTPSPKRHINIINTSTGTSTSTSSLQPPRLQQSQQQRDNGDLQEQLLLAQKQLTDARHANTALVQSHKVQEQKLSDALRQLQDECLLLKSRLEQGNREKNELIQKLRQRDQELEQVQIQMEQQHILEQEANNNVDHFLQMCHCQETNDAREEHFHQENGFVPSHDDDDEELLQAKIDECERELRQQFGVVLDAGRQNEDIPREIYTRPTPTREHPSSTTTPNMVHYFSMGLAQSLIGLLNNQEKEDQVMDRLGLLSQLLYHDDDDDDDDDIIRHEPVLVPFQMYQQLTKKCHQLELERSAVICETLNLMESVREANFLEMEILEKELKASFQTKVEKCVADIVSSRERL
jgi:hypothetical protein